jgi:hypothetical protein
MGGWGVVLVLSMLHFWVPRCFSVNEDVAQTFHGLVYSPAVLHGMLVAHIISKVLSIPIYAVAIHFRHVIPHGQVLTNEEDRRGT